MSTMHVPKQIDPIKLAEMRRHLKGTLALGQMGRLCDLLHSSEGEVAVALEFGIDAQGLRYIVGEAETDVLLVCQRCLQPFNYALKSNISLSPITDDSKAAALPDYYEPLMVTEEPVILAEMIEEELILSMPLVALHDPKVCTVQLKPTESQQAKPNPFEVLQSLKDNFKTDE